MVAAYLLCWFTGLNMKSDLITLEDLITETGLATMHVGLLTLTLEVVKDPILAGATSPAVNRVVWLPWSFF